MRELWIFIYFCFFPLAYIGLSGMLGKEAQDAANQFFDWLGRALAFIGIVMMIALFAPIIVAIVETLLAAVIGLFS
jgi:hypothetical protein